MDINRSSTPPRLSVITNFVYNLNTKLNDKEFPMYNESGKLNCPPAPPNKTKEIRVCPCKQTYQIRLKTDPTTKCGNCSK